MNKRYPGLSSVQSTQNWELERCGGYLLASTWAVYRQINLLSQQRSRALEDLDLRSYSYQRTLLMNVFVKISWNIPAASISFHLLFNYGNKIMANISQINLIHSVQITGKMLCLVRSAVYEVDFMMGREICEHLNKAVGYLLLLLLFSLFPHKHLL